MTPNAERQAIESRFQTAWALAYPAPSAIPVAYENFPFRPTATQIEWAELFVIHNNEQNISMGGAATGYRRHGIIQVNIYVKKNSGAKRFRDLLESAAVIFRNTEFSSITCRAAEINQLGDSDIWYKASVSISFFTTN